MLNIGFNYTVPITVQGYILQLQRLKYHLTGQTASLP